MERFHFSGSAPQSANGIPVERVTFTNGRTAVEVAHHGGICGIAYYGNQRLSDTKLFTADVLSAWAQLFRPFADFGRDDCWLLEFGKTTLYPFGMDAECETAHGKFIHRMTVLNDAIIWELETADLKMPEWRLTLSCTWTCGPVQSPSHHWEEFTPQEGGLCSTACRSIYEKSKRQKKTSLTQSLLGLEPDTAGTFMTLAAADKKGEYRKSINKLIRKFWYSSSAQKGYAAMVLAFGTTQEESVRRAKELAANPRKFADDARKTYQTNIRRQTKLVTNDKLIDNFFRNVPEVVRSLQVKDIAGAYRAGDSGYWVWGWDTMVHSDGIMLSGDWASVLNRLDFYCRTADKKMGVLHAFALDNTPLMSMAPAAQTIYCIMLYNYLLYSGDQKGCRKYVDFAISLLDRARKDLDEKTGLYTGVAMYPDFPEDLGQNGHDIAVFNNGILYQAFRCMAAVLKEYRMPRSADFTKWADAMAENFVKYFFDAEEGYFVDSISSEDYTPRKCYPIYAILYLTPFAKDLLRGHEKRIAEYMFKRFTRPIGACMFPADTDIFYKDGNQLGMYMPVLEGLYRRALRYLKKPDTLLPVIRREWGNWRLMEALTCEAVNGGITSDNPGRKQMFTANVWYSELLAVACGLEFSFERLNFLDPGAETAGWSVKNLRWQKGVLDIRFTGKGRAIAAITCDGAKVKGKSIPSASLTSGRHIIEIALQ